MEPQLGWKKSLVLLSALFCLAVACVVSSGPVCSIPRKTAGGNTSRHQLRQICFALFNYEVTRGYRPRDLESSDGSPLLSWRVAILPHLDQQQLYDRFRLDEPWDSVHNLPLANEVVDAYANPYLTHAVRERLRGIPQVTAYAAVRGPGTAWDDEYLTLFDPKGDLCLVLTEAFGSNLIWTKPGDLDVRAMQWRINLPDKPCLRGAYSDEVNILRSDMVACRLSEEDATPEFLGDLVFVLGSPQRPQKSSPLWLKLLRGE